MGHLGNIQRKVPRRCRKKYFVLPPGHAYQISTAASLTTVAIWMFQCHSVWAFCGRCKQVKDMLANVLDGGLRVVSLLVLYELVLQQHDIVDLVATKWVRLIPFRDRHKQVLAMNTFRPTTTELGLGLSSFNIIVNFHINLTANMKSVAPDCALGRLRYAKCVTQIALRRQRYADCVTQTALRRLRYADCVCHRRHCCNAKRLNFWPNDEKFFLE